MKSLMPRNLNLGVFLFVLLMLGFQNCSQVQFGSPSSSQSYKSENNGGSYEGKPIGDFYRFIPDFACEQIEAPLAHIAITASSATLTENERQQCGSMTVGLSLDLIDTSPLQNEVIGYKEGIFEFQATPPARIPSRLIEIWCRDYEYEIGLETMIYRDRTTNTTVSKIYYPTQNPDGTFAIGMVPEFPVDWTTDSTKQGVYNYGNRFELTVHIDQPPLSPGIFLGNAEAMIEGQFIKRKVTCRLGGSLDLRAL